MKANVTKLKRSRTYSVGFKRSLVKEFERGDYSVNELAKLHHVNYQTIYRWIYKYSTSGKPPTEIVEMKDSSTKKLKDLEDKVKELERKVGQKQIYIDYLEKMMDIAKEDLGLDIKKNYDTPRSTGSGKTDHK